MTASTGIARLQFTSGQTIYHWCGYGTHHVNLNTLVERIKTQGAYQRVKENILSCKCLVIDEIGLISLKTFEAVEFLCRNVKQNNLLFGGIQIIAAGSFKQLPPVPSITDSGLFCFQSPLF